MIGKTLTAVCGAILLASGWSAVASAQGQGNPQFTMHVFGDSLSDDGNFFAITGQPPAPYFEGRFSDGPVWVEYLGNMTPNATINNMAVGGSFTDDRNLQGPFGGVRTQVDNFLAGGGAVGEDDLVILWAGANNYLGGDINPAIVVADIADAVNDLAVMADAERFLLVNLPPLGESPAGRDSGNGAGLSLLTDAHNDILALTVDDLRATLGIEIILLDSRDLFDRTLANVFGLQNTTDRCLTATSICENPNKYLFWDGVHPTTAVHSKIAVFAKGALSASNGQGMANAN